MHDVKLLRDFGQPNLDLTIDRRQAARFGINVTDIQDAVQTAVGGNAVSQVLIGEQRYDVVVRYQQPYRNTAQAIENVRLLSPTGERVSLAQLTKVEVKDGAYDIYREGKQPLCGGHLQRARPGSGDHGGRGDQSRSMKK